jgi:hypothetical protein
MSIAVAALDPSDEAGILLAPKSDSPKLKVGESLPQWLKQGTNLKKAL